MTFLTSTNPVVTISGIAPISSTEGVTPVISIQDSTIEQKGAVQLEDGVVSTSTTKAATPNSVRETYEYITSMSGGLQADIDSKSDTLHTHDDRYYTESEVDDLITTISGGTGTSIHSELSNLDYVSSGHTGFQPSGDYITDSELISVSGSLQTNIDGKSDTAHLHDDQYYTESEVDTISGSLQTNIDGKSDTSHLHDDRYYTETELNNGQLDTRYYTELEVDTISGSLQTNIDEKSDTGHLHDDRYYTESEVDTISGTISTEIDDDIVTHAGNSDAHHSEIHTVVSHFDTTATGANLNELVGSGDTSLHKHDTMYYTESEIDTLSGTLQTDIDTKLENVVEDLDPELGSDLSCNNYNIENVGKMCASNLASTIYNGTGSTLTKGTAITICGLQGEICTVCASDNREIGKMPCCGVIESDVADGAEGCGIRIGRLNMDTSGMTGNVEDRLYVQADGSLDTVIPTSGMVQRVGLLVVKASGSAGRICICIRGPRSMYSAKDQHPIVRMGDDAGHQKTVFKDYTDNEVAAFDSSGNLTLSGTVDGVDIAALETDVIFNTDVANYADSPMIVTGGVVEYGTDAGTFKVTALTALLRKTASDIGELDYVTKTEEDNIEITVAETVYIASLNYNSGTPTVSISTSAPNFTQNISLGKVYKEVDNTVHFAGGGYRLQDGVGKLHRRAKDLRQMELSSGGTIAYSGTNNFTMASTTIYGGLNEFTLVEYDSAVTAFNYVYQDGGGGWTTTSGNTIDYNHYDDGDGGLELVGNNKYSCHWVYRHSDDSDVYIVYGRGSYSLSEAETSEEPTHPSFFDHFGTLIGCIVAPVAGGLFISIQMVTDRFFTGTSVSTHNDLGGLNNGDYKHLTAANHTDLTDGNVCTAHKHDISEDITPELGGQLGVGEHDIKLDSSLSADEKYSGETFDGTLGETVGFGNLVYLKSDRKWWKTDADTEATSGNVQLAITLVSGIADETKLLMRNGFVRDDSWTFTSYGQAIFVSCTAGEMTETAPNATGDIVRVVAHASTVSGGYQIEFAPSQTWIELS